MPHANPHDVTTLLLRWGAGDRGALDALLQTLYGELRRLADAYLRREAAGHVLQPTALVHEAWLRLANHDQLSFDHRRQFFGLAAKVMRNVLVDHARAAGADKRGGGVHLTTLSDHVGASNSRSVDLLALDEALAQLSTMNPRQARVIELRYFGGLEIAETAEALEISTATVSRDQRIAEAWLGHVLSGGAPA